jgi:sec-independent protein translocase protein TatA
MIGNIGPVQLLIILLIVLLVFGTKKIRGLGSDLGGAIREFRKGVSEDAEASAPPAESNAKNDAKPEEGDRSDTPPPRD